MSRYGLLSADEEKDLARRMAKGDDDARKQMIRGNLRLVIAIAKNYVDRGLSFLDIIEEGNIGLMKAVERFNPDLGCKLSTYASWWIRQCIRRAIIDKAKNVRIPGHMVEHLTKWRLSADRLRHELGREPSPEEIASTLRLPAHKRDLIKRTAAMLSFPVRPDDKAFEKLDEMPSRDTEQLSDLDRSELNRAVDQMLLAREQEVIRRRFGLGGKKSETLEQVGNRLGLTRERIRQIEQRALRKLFIFLTSKEGGFR